MERITPQSTLDDLQNLTLEKVTIRTPKFPSGLKIADEMGKGSNNQVIAAKWDGSHCVLRVPRRKSDTQQRGSAIWELKQTLHASRMGAAPKVLDAWYVRHAKGPWTSGLYMILERLDCTLDDALGDPECEVFEDMFEKESGGAETAIAQIGASVVTALDNLAQTNLFVFDLKPSNLLLKRGEGGEEGETMKGYVIDFGRDFCEWEQDSRLADARTPIIDGLRKLISERKGEEKDASALTQHILFSAMLVQLSAITTFNMVSDRRKSRFTHTEREKYNPFLPYAKKLLASMRGQNMTLLKWVLRDDEVRGVLRHYLGRRNSGTRRVLAMAQGTERP